MSEHDTVWQSILSKVVLVCLHVKQKKSRLEGEHAQNAIVFLPGDIFSVRVVCDICSTRAKFQSVTTHHEYQKHSMRWVVWRWIKVTRFGIAVLKSFLIWDFYCVVNMSWEWAIPTLGAVTRSTTQWMCQVNSRSQMEMATMRQCWSQSCATFKQI